MQYLTEKDGVKTFYAPDAASWRRWLEENHQKEKRVWLIIYHKKSKTPSVYYDEAVDEALCFGWIDSKPNKRDEESFYQFFSVRNPKSRWSRVNKLKIEKLMQEGKMNESGLKAIEIAKLKGTWTALDDIEKLIVPEDLLQKLEKNPVAKAFFEAFPPSVKRGILEWIISAKQAETRAKRVEETVNLATRNERANQYRKKN